MRAKTLLNATSWLALPVVFVGLYVLAVSVNGYPIERWIPKWYTLTVLASIVVQERIYAYRYRVSQRPMLFRDLLSSIVNIYFSAAAATFVVGATLGSAMTLLLGRGVLIAAPETLGPVWFQIPVLLIGVSFFRYWMHRWQHSNEFLWKLHSYHHAVTDLQASNTYVSHPIDWALRNALVFALLGLTGFDPQALFIVSPVMIISGIYSHCGADVKGGVLNYIFATPEVHRWHHAVDVPKGYGYAVNYGVEFSFWDIAFGTFYLPQRVGLEPEQPPRLGHPGGMADERSYLKILLAPFGLYGPIAWAKRTLGMRGEEQIHPAE